MTAEELLGMPDDGNRYELIEGKLIVNSPAGGEHGQIAAQIAGLLWTHVSANRLGRILVAEPGFLLARDPDTVRAPDVAFVSKERLEKLADRRGYLELAPDLAVEVVSPTDTFTAVQQKAQAWLAAGTRMVLVVDPETRRVHVYQPAGTVAVLGTDDELDAADAVPGWRVPVRRFFE